MMTVPANCMVHLELNNHQCGSSLNIRGAVQKTCPLRGGGGGGGAKPLSAIENVSFCWGGKKCLKCSETQEYAKKIVTFL